MYVLLGGLIGVCAGYAAAQFHLGGGNAALAVLLAILPGLFGQVIAAATLRRRQALAAAAMAEVVGEENFLVAGRALAAARSEPQDDASDTGFDDADFGLTAPDPVQTDTFHGVLTGANSLPAGYHRKW